MSALLAVCVSTCNDLLLRLGRVEDSTRPCRPRAVRRCELSASAGADAGRSGRCTGSSAIAAADLSSLPAVPGAHGVGCRVRAFLLLALRRVPVTCSRWRTSPAAIAAVALTFRRGTPLGARWRRCPRSSTRSPRAAATLTRSPVLARPRDAVGQRCCAHRLLVEPWLLPRVLATPVCPTARQLAAAGTDGQRGCAKPSRPSSPGS